jgi:hypothetical protein
MTPARKTTGQEMRLRGNRGAGFLAIFMGFFKGIA